MGMGRRRRFVSMEYRMKRVEIRKVAAGAAVLAGLVFAASCGQKADPPIGELLPTGKAITSETQPAQDVGSMPMNVAVTPDGRYAVTSDMGLYQWLWVIRTSDGKGVSHVAFANPAPKAATKTPARAGGEDDTEGTAPGSPRSNGLYYGLAISKDNTVYAAQGAHDSVAVLKLADD